MKMSKSLKLGIFFLIGILLMTSFVLAYYRSQTNYVQYGPYDRGGLFGTYTMDRCEAGQDFILQVSPLGCEPMVRSDLLEEQNVPVFCPITATQMNPLIDVEAINYMTITGRYPKEVATVGFHPAQAALSPPRQNELTQPVVLDNIGYAVIVLRKQPNESAMPDYVEGNLTAKIRYDIHNAFGIGQSSFYLPVLEEKDWEEKYKQYSFWDGRGYLRADGVYDGRAIISIYSDQYRSGVLGHGDEKLLYSKVELKERETSNNTYIPGFDFCLATMQVRLEGLETPDERARFRVNGNPVEVARDGKFLENNCRVKSIRKDGINSEVEFRCKEDREGFHKGDIDLRITPSIVLDIGGGIVNKSVGEYLFKDGSTLNRKVFLGYVGTTENTGAEEDLFIYLIALPTEKHLSDKLTLEEIEDAEKIAKAFQFQTDVKDTNLWGVAKESLEAVVGFQRKGWEALTDQESFEGVGYKEPKSLFGKEVELLGFAGAFDQDIPEEAEDEFNAAVEDYRLIIEDFPDEMNEEEKITLGESALYNLINLANGVEQKRTMMELCEEFEQKYPDSKKSLKMCKDELKISSSSTAITEVLIDDHIYQISFEGVYEPSRYEYSAKVKVTFPSEDNKATQTFYLTKNEKVYVNPSENEYIMLEELKEDSAKLELNIRRRGRGDSIEDKSETLNLNVPESFSSEYSLVLEEVNLKKAAKVSLIPNDDYAGTNASFNFRVNIDKRDIKLSPEKTEERIENLEEAIERWGSISDGLGKFVQTMKGACLGTSAYLTVKNYLDNIDGKGIARAAIMNADNGWYERCDEWVRNEVSVGGKIYKTTDGCLTANSDEIDKDIDTYYGFMSELQSDMREIQERPGIKIEGKLFSVDRANTKEFAGVYSGGFTEGLEANLENYISEGEFLDPKGKGDPINIDNIKKVFSKQGFEENKYSIQQLRDADLYTRILAGDASEEIKEMAKQGLYSTLLDVQVNSKEFSELQDLASKYGASEVILGSSELLEEYYISNPSTFSEVKSEFSGGNSIDSSSPVIVYKDESNAKEYLIVLELLLQPTHEDYVINQTYSITGNLLGVADEENINPLKLGFKKYDDTSYTNKYENSEVRYYETEPYKGNPALVPFDKNNGWYVAVKQDLPVFGGIRSYDKSGVVRTFYLCNVGENGREENIKGDDTCRSINTISGETYQQFPGISDKGKVTTLIIEAIKAVEQAQDQHRTGVRNVKIDTSFGVYSFPVGNPAVDVPGMQCQDFMSPKDCNIMFNVCDPVVCPSSRCNFGGNYHVQDVVQSGIIGSIALCFPNRHEGIHVPVCLSGVQAGLDGLLSIFNSYQDCLQESLDTGQTIGICDEVRSIYMCEYFYRRAIPIAKIGIPKLTELLIGRGTRGGGEYLGVADAWQRAQGSWDYFSQYYAQNSYKAFKARSIEEAGQEIACKGFISLRYPDGGGLLDTITTPDSPVQFYGKFDEIPYTTVTNPPQSQYKVTYHIYAGKDRGAYYRVYLRGDSGSSFYRDNIFRIDVDTGYIGRGDYATESKDFTAPSGYKELCIMVNGQEECGFKEVTTSLAVNYIENKYLSEQASQTDIKTESECVSGTASLYNLLNPNLQAGAEDVINPSLYNEGIIRICATRNPGEGTNPSRWNNVGYCGDQNLKCWLDTKSVENAIDFENIEEDVLKNTNENYQEILREEGGYSTEEDFSSKVKEIDNAESNIEKINLVNEFLDRVFLNSERASLLYLRGNAYATIAKVKYKAYREEQKAEEEELTGGDSLNEDEQEIVKEKINLIESFFSSSNFKSSVLEFRNGVVGKDVYVQFKNGGWYLTSKKSTASSSTDWASADGNLRGFDLSSEGFGLAKELKSKDYVSGIGELNSFLINYDEKTLTSSKPKIKSFDSSSEFNTKEIFRISEVEGVKDIYFKYNFNKWVWSYNKRSNIKDWNEVTEIVLKVESASGSAGYGTISTGVSVSEELPEEYKLLIGSLEDRSENLGAAIIYNHKGIIRFLTQGISLEEEVQDEEEQEEETTFEEQVAKLGWENWGDIENALSEFSNKEKNVILNAEKCGDCGSGLRNDCDEKECVAIGFKLREKDELSYTCVYEKGGVIKIPFTTLKTKGSCEKVVLEEEMDWEDWQSWEDVKNNLRKEFNEKEMYVILNAKSCDECGKEKADTKGGYKCDEKECRAISLKLSDSLKLGKKCSHQGTICFESPLESEEEGIVDVGGLGDIPGGEDCEPVEPLSEVEDIDNARLKVVEATKILEGESSAEFKDCYVSAKYVYEKAGVSDKCVYSDKDGKIYPLEELSIEMGKETPDGFTFQINEGCPIVGEDERDKLNLLAPGYLISYYWDTNTKYPNGVGHNAIFVRWEDQSSNLAKLFDWNGPEDTFRYYEHNLSDTEHPLYVIWKPEKLA